MATVSIVRVVVIVDYLVAASSVHMTIETTTGNLVCRGCNQLLISFICVRSALLDHLIDDPSSFADASCVSAAKTDTMIFRDVFRCHVMRADMLTLFNIVHADMMLLLTMLATIVIV